MAGTFARPGIAAGLSAVLLTFVAGAAALGQDSPQPQQPQQAQPQQPQLPPISRECQGGGADAAAAQPPLPRIAAALQQTRKIKVQAIGGVSLGEFPGRRKSHYDILEAILQNAVKGLHVKIVDRGVSGELAAAAAERMKIEIARLNPDLVIWQVGTADALAIVPVEDFTATVTDTVRWMKERGIDVMLVGLAYTRNVALDQHYQAMKKALRQVGEAEKVPVMSRYDVVEAMERAKQASEGTPPGDAELGEAGYVCLAQHLGRAIAIRLFAMPKQR